MSHHTVQELFLSQQSCFGIFKLLGHTACTLHCTTPFPPTKNCPFLWRILDPHLIHRSFGPTKPPPNLASRSSQPFLHNTLCKNGWTYQHSLTEHGIWHVPTSNSYTEVKERMSSNKWVMGRVKCERFFPGSSKKNCEGVIMSEILNYQAHVHFY